MKLTLTNFRCHSNGSFTIPDNGLILLAGESGAGKSTVLTAICYALYGKINGKIKKPYTHGKNTSKVELEYESRGLSVVRTSKPNRLLVTYDGVEYEDDAAQSVIDMAMGMNYIEFLASSYIIQNRDVSVLTMTPTEQVDFIHNLAFSSTTSEVTVEAVKNAIKENMRNITEEKKQVESQILLLQSQIADKSIDEPEIPDEIKQGIRGDTIREEIRKLNDELTTINRKIELMSSKLQEARSISKKTQTTRDAISKYELEIAFNNDKLAQLKTQIGTQTLQQFEEEHALLQKAYSINTYIQNIDEQQAQYESMKADHIQQLTQKIDELQGKLLSNDTILHLRKENEELNGEMLIFNKLDAKRKAIQIFNETKDWSFYFYNFDNSNPSELLKYLILQRENIYSQIKGIVSSENIKDCPVCCTQLSVHQDHIFKVDDTVDDVDSMLFASYNLLSEKINNINSIIDDLNIPDPRFSTILEYKKKIDANEKLVMKNDYTLEEIERLSSPQSATTPTLDKMKSKIDETRKLIENESKDPRTTKVIKNEMNKIAMEMNKLTQLTSDVEEINRIIENLNKKIKKSSAELLIETGGKGLSIEELENTSSELTATLMQINEQIHDKRRTLDNIAEYESYQRNQKDITRLQNTISNKQAEIEEILVRYDGYVGLDKSCKEAEILALDKTIASINEHAKVYLEKMFEEPIHVRLESVKEVGKVTKLQVHTLIEYHGETYDNIDELSGGEKQRCELAFLLAVNDMLGSPMLLLDECLNNLDSTINTEVLTFLREICEDKMLLVVSHEAVRGVFEHEVEISH